MNIKELNEFFDKYNMPEFEKVWDIKSYVIEYTPKKIKVGDDIFIFSKKVKDKYKRITYYYINVKNKDEFIGVKHFNNYESFSDSAWKDSFLRRKSLPHYKNIEELKKAKFPVPSEIIIEDCLYKDKTDSRLYQLDDKTLNKKNFQYLYSIEDGDGLDCYIDDKVTIFSAYYN